MRFKWETQYIHSQKSLLLSPLDGKAPGWGQSLEFPSTEEEDTGLV